MFSTQRKAESLAFIRWDPERQKIVARTHTACYWGREIWDPQKCYCRSDTTPQLCWTLMSKVYLVRRFGSSLYSRLQMFHCHHVRIFCCSHIFNRGETSNLNVGNHLKDYKPEDKNPHNDGYFSNQRQS